MATLQKIRSKGPLLVVVIGLALFAFIAGDAWKILQPHQGKQEIGEIDSESLSAQDYQKILDEYTEVVKFSSGLSALTDEQLTQIKDEVWRSYVNNKLIENEARKLGLTVSDEEITAIIEEGTNPMLQQTPFRNPQTGAFDKDMLKKFLVDYAKMDKAQMPANYVEYYQSMNKFWNFIEKTLRQNKLMEKYQNLITKALISNPIEAQATFDGRVNQYDMLLAAIPYTSIPDSIITVSDSELKNLYNKKKEQFKQTVETRNFKYIDVQIKPSDADRAAIQEEVTEYTNQLGNVSDYVSFIRATGSNFPYMDVLYSKNVYPSDIVSRLDSVKVGEVYGPYYNQGDDSYNSFRLLTKQIAPDSVQYRQIQVYTEDVTKTKTLADSIYNAVKNGADFVELAKKYNSNGETTWLTSQQYEKSSLDADNTKFINAVTNANVNDLVNLSLGQGNIIIQVLDKKGMKDKYKVAIIKRSAEFSKETYNKAYNDFSQFIASNGTLDKLTANAEENGYRLLERNDFYSSEHAVGGIQGTREALKWIFSAKPGEVSPLYECGESDRLLVVALTGINEEGYRPLNAVKDQLKAEIIKDKKAEKIIADIKAKDLNNFEQYKSVPNVLTDSVKHVTFSTPTYVAMTRGSEPSLGAYASISENNKVSGPIKGNAGVYALQVYNKDKTKETFNDKSEEETIKNMSTRTVSRFINDLYMKANVKDSRYLFF